MAVPGRKDLGIPNLPVLRQGWEPDPGLGQDLGGIVGLDLGLRDHAGAQQGRLVRVQGIFDEGRRLGRGLAVGDAQSDLPMGKPAEADERHHGGNPAELQAELLPGKGPLKPDGRPNHGFRRAGQGGSVEQPQGIAILQIGHDPRGRLRSVGEMLLDLDPPGRVELVVHIGQKVGFGDGVRHRAPPTMRRRGRLPSDGCGRSVPASKPRSAARARPRRDMSVPTGMSRASAASW